MQRMREMPPNINLLFPSVGRRVELIRAFKRAYAALGISGTIIGLDIDPLAPAFQVVDRPYIAPRTSSPDYVPYLLEISTREQAHAIFPLIDPDIPILALNRDQFEALGVRIGTISRNAIDVVDDKWAATRFFQSLGIPTPTTYSPEALPGETAEFPLIVKPRRGSASQNVFRVNNARELEFFVNYVSEPLVQEFVSGAEITNDVLVNFEGEVLAVVSRQRLQVRGGEVVKSVTIKDAVIAAYCAQIAESLSTTGPITVQCIMKGNVPCFTEINARMGGGLPLSIAAGVDFPAIILAHLAQIRDAAGLLTHQYQAGLFMTRFDESFFITEDDRQHLASKALD